MSTKSPVTPRHRYHNRLHYDKDLGYSDFNIRPDASSKSSLFKLTSSPSGMDSKPVFKLQSPRKNQSVIDSTPSILQLNVVTNDWSNAGNIAANQTSPRKKKVVTDRFIPKVAGAGAGTKLDTSKEESRESDRAETSSSLPATSHHEIASACGVSLSTRILEFQPPPPVSKNPIDLRSVYNRPVKPAVSAVNRRKVPTCPERVLDAPGILDDYYLNLLDWSCGNQVAVALEKSVYVWNAETGSVGELLETRESYIASVKWSGDGAYLAVGLSNGDVQIWDVEEQTKLRSMLGQTSRVGVTSWDRHILSSGSRGGSIFNHDVRIAAHKVSEMNFHQGEVCGLDWRSDSSQLASGANDNTVCIWDARSVAAPRFTKTNHKAAVKAVAWCPWQMNLLATGGGTYDKYIHFWNSTTGARVNSIDTGSQVTSIKWSHHYKELVSTHGFPNNNLSLWSYPTCTKIVDVVAHDSRVLHATLSPDGQTLATCASDENLKFWKIFESSQRKAVQPGSIQTKEMGKTMMIR